MAIAVGNTNSNGQDSGATNTVSHSLSAASGNNRCVIACIHIWDAFAGGPPTGVTYNGVAMTLAASVTTTVAAALYTYIYYILDADLPAGTGNYNVVASIGANAQSIMGVTDYTGVFQAAPPSTGTNSGVGAGTVATCDITTLNDNSWIVCGALGDNVASSWTATAPLVERYDVATIASTATGSDRSTTTAGTFTLTETCASTFGGFTMAEVELREATAVAPDVAVFMGTEF